MRISVVLPRRLVAVIVLASALFMGGCFAESHEPGGGSAGALNANCNYPSTLEITSINIGQGDSTLIATPEALILADAGESYWNSHQDALAVDAVIQAKYGCRALDYVIISHLQVDHVGYVNYGGLYYLANDLGYEIGETLLRDFSANVGTTSGTYDNWRTYFESPEGQATLNPRVVAVGDQLDLGAGIQLTITTVDTRSPSCPGGWGSAPDGSCGGEYAPGEVLGDHRGESPAPDENDYSVSFVVSVGSFDMFIGGDLNGETSDSGFGTKRHDIESYAGPDVGEVDVLRVNHHGSHHSSNSVFMAAVDPQAALVSVGNANTYGHSRQVAVDRILSVHGGVPQRPIPLYFTERGDDGPGGCIEDRTNTPNAAANLYGFGTIVSDTDGDYCTVEGGNTDVVVAADGATFTIEGDLFTSRDGTANVCDGDGLCETDEDCTSCPGDCASGSGASCGNGVCEAGDGEDCLSCPSDCQGRQSGRPGNRYCCGDGDGEGPVACSDSRCGACTNVPATPWCCGDGSCGGDETSLMCAIDCGPAPFCGDGTCDAGEDACECGADCGVAPSTEVPGSTCSDGLDQDCDSKVDCADADCAADAACAPPACDGDGVCESGEDCGNCASDCAGVTGGRRSNRHCCGDGAAEDAEGDGVICDGNY